MDTTAGADAPGSRLGVRAERRGQPRVGTTTAAAGAFVVFSGAMTLALDASTGGGDGGGSSTPGTIITLAVVVAGYALLAVQRRGPFATAGLVAFAIALPFFVGFATFSESDFPPISIDAILGLSTAGWGLAYALGPSRGHPFLLGATLLGGWLFLLEQVTELFTAPFAFLESFFFAFGPEEDVFGGSPGAFQGPDATEIAVVCGLVAIAYLGLSRPVERRGADGVATPMVAVGHAAAIVAVLAFTDDLQEIGTGILAVAVGGALMLRGVTAERRATTWLGGVYLVAGLQSVVAGLTDSATAGGALLIGLGLGVVVLAALLVQVTDEPDDDEPGPSFPGGLRRPAMAAAAEAPGATTTMPERPPVDGPPGEGWWIASDGRWYPPEQHPDRRGPG